VGNTGEAFARVEIGKGPSRHDHGMLFRLEDVLDAHAEERRDAKRQWKTRVVLFIFERVHGLTRDLEPVRELALRPVTLGTQHAKAILHR
jgi:hypothetical protein